MSISTKTGDNGQTSLMDGSRVDKDDLRIETCGSLDELIAVLGLLKATLPQSMNVFHDELEALQTTLMHITGSVAASSMQLSEQVPSVNPEDLDWLENRIGYLSDQLPSIHEFIVPGHDALSSTAHLARTVCRRAERHMVSLYKSLDKEKEEDGFEIMLKYMNRLSDYLFVLAEWIAQSVKNKGGCT